MLKVDFDSSFQKTFSKIKEKDIKVKIIKQLKKLKKNPKLGKPMRYTRKGTRELYVAPWRLSYIFLEKEKTIVILDIYHKDKQ